MISTKEYVARRRRHTASLLDRLLLPKHRLLQQLSPGAKSGLLDGYQAMSQHVQFFHSLLCGVGYHTVTVGWQLRLPQRQYKQRRSCLSKLSVFFAIRFDTVSDLVSFGWQNRFSRKPSVFWQQYAECVSWLRNNPIAAHLEQGN